MIHVWRFAIAACFLFKLEGHKKGEKIKWYQSDSSPYNNYKHRS